MAAADFCLITRHVAMQGAAIGPHVRQISPDKSVNCHHTTAAFTLSPESGALSCLWGRSHAKSVTKPYGADSPEAWALYAVSVRRLMVLRSGFLQTPPRGDALAFG